MYAIEGLSADEWLVTEEGYVLYADGVHLPTLTEMKPDAVQVCAYRQSIHVLRTVTGADILSDAVRAYTEGENIEYLGLEAQHSYKLRFTSAAYPALYFSPAVYRVRRGYGVGRCELRQIFSARRLRRQIRGGRGRTASADVRRRNHGDCLRDRKPAGKQREWGMRI